MPTFMFFRNKTKVDKMQGADNKVLEDTIKKHYGEEGGEGEEAGVKGMMDLATFVDKSRSECLNEDDEHPYQHCLTSAGGFLQSDCDEQLILSISFNQNVKIHSLKVKGPSDKGPKTVSSPLHSTFEYFLDLNLFISAENLHEPTQYAGL